MMQFFTKYPLVKRKEVTTLREVRIQSTNAKYTDDYDVKPYDFSHLPSIVSL